MKEPFMVTESELAIIAKKVVDTLASSYTTQAKVLFLEGDLGAGKTTFTKELASVLGITKEDVHSPTFILKKEYKGEHSFFKKLIHIDAYRFENPDEVKVLKLKNDLDNHDTLIVIEWPSKLGGVINEDMTIAFSVIDDDTREVMINYANGHIGNHGEIRKEEVQEIAREIERAETPHRHISNYFPS
jgi:tRNA threonylcarbamoyladenosine biosynthesis protein TsaE